MKITLDTADVKQSITEFLINRNIITEEQELGFDIQKLRSSEEDVRIEVEILGDGVRPAPRREREEEEEPAAKQKNLFSDIQE